jgi:hypothetical protein
VGRRRRSRRRGSHPNSVEGVGSKWCGRGRQGTGVEATGPSHPDGVGSGAEGSSLNLGVRSGADASSTRIQETRAEQARVSDTRNRPDVRTLVFLFT